MKNKKSHFMYFQKCVMKKYFPVILEWIIKIFFIGLLIQFFLQTFVTYRLGLNGGFRNWIWVWKEIVILFMIIIVFVGIIAVIKNDGVKLFYNKLRKSSIFNFVCFFLAACVISFILAVLVQKVGLGTYILSVKYDLLGFLLFLLGVGLVRFSPLEKHNFEKRYQNILKFTVYGGIIRWITLYLVPGALRLFGYSRETFEGTLGGNPPAVYYTQINRGLVRNQFLFERPITFGFFLVAFWPLFALGYLRKQTRKYQILWTIAFGALVFSTLSRAAIGVRLLETAIGISIIYWKQLKKVIMYAIIPVLIILVCGVWYFRGALERTHSNTGHIVLLEEGVKLGIEKPLSGRGAGYSGPASHQICYNAKGNERCEVIKKINQRYEITTFGYNPENQYVQIFMEYGLLGLIPRLLCFGWLIWEGIKVIRQLMDEQKKLKKVDQRKLSKLYLLFAFGLGMSGLAIEGLVLHSFVDRMVVYPFMLLFGLVWGELNKQENEQ